MPDEHHAPSSAELPDELAAELRDAWAAVRPRTTLDEDAPADERTRATMAWMQAAWRAQEAPAGAVPRSVARVRAGRLRVLRHPWRTLAAAAALVLIALGSWSLLQRSPEPVRPEGANQPLAIERPADGPRIASLGPDHLELRSGPVRLILLGPRNSGE